MLDFRLTAALVFHLSVFALKAQDTAFYFMAKVIDADKGNVVSNARVTIKGSFRGTFTDSEGNFTILARKMRSVMEISAPGYFTSYYSTPFLLKPGTKTIRLKAIEGENKEIVSWEKVFRSGKWNILDYETGKQGIFLIARDEETSHHFFHYLNYNKETSAIRLPENFHSFYTSAAGENFLLCADNAYSITISTGNTISLVKYLNIKEFEKKYYNWPVEDAGARYLKYETPDEYYLNNESDVLIRQTYLAYYGQTKKENRRVLFKNISYDRFQKPEGNWKIANELDLGRLPFANEKVVLVKLPVNIIQSGDHLIYFDLEAKKAETFDTTGKLISTGIFYAARKVSLENKIVVDDLNGKIYYCTLEKTGGDSSDAVTIISELNTTSGKLSKKIVLDASSFTSIKIADGFAYYLNQENKTSQRYFLARSKL